MKVMYCRDYYGIDRISSNFLIACAAVAAESWKDHAMSVIQNTFFFLNFMECS